MTESQIRAYELNECIKNHVNDIAIWLNSCELRVSKEFGCGVFATRNIEPNELLFNDKPLMLGPTGNKYEPLVCVICYEKIKNDVCSNLCPGQCGLVLCDKSECAKQHIKECQLLQKWKPKNPNKISFTKLKAVPIIRSLLLCEKSKKFLKLMQKNYICVKNELFFTDEFENFPQDDETLATLRDASAAKNTNAFKVLYQCTNDDDNDNISDVRKWIYVSGLYPIQSLINHKCSPNVRHDVDKNFVSSVLASRSIKKDEQIFVSYTQLLWGTNSRRMHMIMSKQFRCICERCIDPTESSTNLSAIRCMDKSCSGLLLPIEPLNLNSIAKCNCCEKICENKRYLNCCEMAATITRNFMNDKFTLVELEHFFESRLLKIVPNCSQFVVECKLKAIDITSNSCQDLKRIQSYCEDILHTLNKLNVGECSLKGFLAYKLYTIRKKLRNSYEITNAVNNNNQTYNSSFERFLNDDEELWKTAKVILMNVSAAPKDILEN